MKNTVSQDKPPGSTIPEALYRYGVAIAFAAASAAVRLAFFQMLGMRAPFVTFYPAVILAALYGGMRAGLLATVLSACLADFFWMEPARSFTIKDPADLLSLVIFLMSGAMISWITGAMQRAQARATEATSNSANEFRLLAEAMPQMVWTTRADGWNTYFNQQWVDYTGLTLEESHGHGWNKPFHPDDRTRAWDAWQNAVTNRAPYELECRLRRADGVYRWWLVRGVPVLDDNGTVLKWFGTCTDIHDFKLAEEALREREREERFQTLANSIPQLAWIARPDGHIYWYNQRWYECTGTAPEQMEGWGWQSVHDNIELPKVLDRWKACVATGEPFDMTFPLRGADGVFRPFLTRVQPLKDAEGRVLQWFGTNTDVSEQRRAEEQIIQAREAETARRRELELLMEAVPASVWISRDRECRTMTGNAAVYELVSLPLGQNVSQTAPDPERPNFLAYHDGVLIPNDELPMQKAARTGQPQLGSEMEFRFTNGLSKWVYGNAVPLHDSHGELIGAIGAFIDITARKRMEERLRRFYETDLYAVLYWKIDGGVVDVNDQFLRMTGYTREDLQAGRLNWAKITPPEYQALDDDARQQVLETGVHRLYEKEYIRKDGTRVWGLFSAVAYQDDRTQGVSVILDITERKRMEEQNYKLTEAMRQRAAELTASNKELEAFAYSVSHDLRTPLRSIDGFSQALSEDYGDKLDAEGHDYLQRIRGAAQRMAGLIDDLLGLSRVGRLEMNRQKVDLSALARVIASDLQASDRDRKAEFLITDGMWANGDTTLLRLVLENLLGNAWKFTGKRSLSIIEFGVSEHEGKPAWFVRDNGAGFDMARAANLFGVFQRLHKSTDFPGTGVGLATVQRIILRHGGRVWAQSEVGKGATFSFTL